MEIRLPLAVGVVMALAYGGFTGTAPGQDVAAACRSAARSASAAEVRGAVGTCRDNGRGEVGADRVARDKTSPGPSSGPGVVAPPKTPVDVTDPVTGRDAPEHDDEELTEDPAEETDSGETPTADVPDDEESAPEGPLTEDPAEEEPEGEVPAPEEPGTEDPAVEEPGPGDPAVEEPGPGDPAVEGPGTGDPAVEVPGTEDPADEEPVGEGPADVEPPVVDPDTASPPASETGDEPEEAPAPSPAPTPALSGGWEVTTLARALADAAHTMSTAGTANTATANTATASHRP